MPRLTSIKPKVEDGWEHVCNSFLLHKTAQGVSDRTLTDYKYHVSLFFSAYPSIDEKLEENVLKYFASCSHLAPGTFNIRRRYLNAFFNWCVDAGLLQVNPVANIRRRKTEPRVRLIPEKDLRKLLKLPNQKTYTGLRDYTFMLLSLDTGIRPSEAVALADSDINLKGLEVFVRPEVSKTKTARTLPISKAVSAALMRLLSVNEKHFPGSCVFYSSEGGQLSGNAWSLRLRFYSEKLGVTISPYDLRHTFAVMYIRAGGDAFSLQRLMGHADMEMTKHYANLTQSDLKEKHSESSPLNALISRKKRIRKL